MDCSNFTEGEEACILHEQEETSSPRAETVMCSPTKKSGSTIRGIFSKWRSSSQEASVDKGEDNKDNQKLSSAETNAQTYSSNKGRESSLFGLLPLAALRAAASRESLAGLGGDGSGPNSQTNTPAESPSFLAKQVSLSQFFLLPSFCLL